MESIPLALYSVLTAELSKARPKTPDFLNGYLTSLARDEAITRLSSDYLKKFQKSNKDADKAAIDLFLEMNSRCSDYQPPVLQTNLTSSDEQLFGTFLMLIDDFFHQDVGPDCDFTWDNVVSYAKHGPGAAVGSTGLSFYAKTSCTPVTSTSQFLDDLYEASLYSVPFGTLAESFRRKYHGAPIRVSGSRMTVVPKNEKISRLICIEPLINQYLQQGMGEILSRRLKRLLGIDLALQPDINRSMAFLGSSSQDSLATIDLKSASDTLSMKLLNTIIPSDIFSMLVSLRSSETSVNGSTVQLHMMSTMGNGFTFPLQTIIFGCAVLASMWEDRSFHNGIDRSDDTRPHLIPSGLSSGWSVFGDDIVIESRAYHKLQRLLEMCGCIVNSEKSFSSGSFRESCGRDFFHGYNVRPVYLKRLRSRADFTVALNQLLDWSRRTRIPLPDTIGFLIKAYRKRRWKLNIVPMAENDDAGLRVEFEIAAIVAGFKVNTNGSFVYESRKSTPHTYTIRDSGRVVGPKGSKSLKYDPHGLLRAFLLGEVRGGQIIAKRNGPIPYSTTRCVTPNWDYVPSNQECGFHYAPDTSIASRALSTTFLVPLLQEVR